MAPGNSPIIKLSAARATPLNIRLAQNRIIDSVYERARTAQAMLRAGKSLKHIQNETGFSKAQVKSFKPKGPVLSHYVTYTKQGQSLYPTVRVDRIDPVTKKPLSLGERMVLGRFKTLHEAQAAAHRAPIYDITPEAKAAPQAPAA